MRTESETCEDMSRSKSCSYLALEAAGDALSEEDLVQKRAPREQAVSRMPPCWMEHDPARQRRRSTAVASTPAQEEDERDCAMVLPLRGVRR